MGAEAVRLTVRSAVNNEILGIFVQDKYPIGFMFVSGCPELKAEAERLQRIGLIEIIQDEAGRAAQRVTKVDDPQLLPRLAADLSRQFGFRVDLVGSPSEGSGNGE